MEDQLSELNKSWSCQNVQLSELDQTWNFQTTRCSELNQSLGFQNQSLSFHNRTLSSLRSFRIASCRIDPNVLRAVRACDALRQCGLILRSSIGDSATYNLGVVVERIDTFWSHSWRAPSRQKIAALYYHYNGFTAACASLIVAFGTAALIQMDLLGERRCIADGCSSHKACSSGYNSSKYYCTNSFAELVGYRCMPVLDCCLAQGNNSIDGQCPAECPSETPYVFHHWPLLFGFAAWILAFIGHRPLELVFLDKICIHQTDGEQKRQGIDGLGGFLRVSKEILVLWDPTYFSRLWCTMELAASFFIHEVKVNVLPIVRSFVPLCIVLMTLNKLVALWTPQAFRLLLLVFHSQLFLYMARHYHYQIGIMQRQIQEFKCNKAQCFCCTVGHQMPDTQEPIDCDRVAIYTAINAWFPGGLREFEAKVHAMESQFSDMIGPHIVRFKDVLFLLLPELWDVVSVSDISFCQSLTSFQDVLLGCLGWSSGHIVLYTFVMLMASFLPVRRGFCDMMILFVAGIIVAMLYICLGAIQFFMLYASGPRRFLFYCIGFAVARLLIIDCRKLGSRVEMVRLQSEQMLRLQSERITRWQSERMRQQS